MCLAVDEPDPGVDDGVAGQHALLELGASALLDRRDELSGHRSADHLVHELDPGPRSRGSISGTRHTARARRLLDQPALHLRGTHEGLPQRRAQRLDLDLDVVTVLQAGDELVHVAWPIAQSTTWWVSALCRAHRTSSATIRCRAAQLVLVALGLRVDRHGQQRLGQDPGSTSAGLSFPDSVSRSLHG